jgi:hypothetical protein
MLIGHYLSHKYGKNFLTPNHILYVFHCFHHILCKIFIVNIHLYKHHVQVVQDVEALPLATLD